MLWNLYNNTVLDGSVILSVWLFAIETTFPLSDFKTKHIFGILVERVKFLKQFGAPKAPQFFLLSPIFLLLFFYFGAPPVPQIFFFFTFGTKGGAEGTTPP